MNIVFFCVGSNKVVSDSYAPFIGSMLLKNNVRAFVYGTINSPINALNIDYYIEMLRKYHSKDKVIVIDSRIVKNKSIGVKFERGEIEVASTTLKRVLGDYHITLDISIESLKDIGLDYVIRKAIFTQKKLSSFLVK